MNVLSTFDGMSCLRIVFNKLQIPVTNYFASEIDKYAIQVSKANWTDVQHIGDVTKVHAADLPRIDLLAGGPPCQGFSFAGKQLNFEDPRSKLFFEFVRLLKEIREYNPGVYFFLENVVMKKEYQAAISEALGVQPILINSALICAQNRKRLYWTNIPFFGQPEDRGIVLKDILETDYDFILKNRKNKLKNDSSKAGCLTGGHRGDGNHSDMDVIVKKDFSPKLTYVGNIDIHVNPFARRYSLVEAERLQGVPDGYTQHVSNTQAYKMLSNGWQIDTIEHLLEPLKYVL